MDFNTYILRYEIEQNDTIAWNIPSLTYVIVTCWLDQYDVQELFIADSSTYYNTQWNFVITMTRQVSLLQVVIQAFISIDKSERENVHIIVPQKMFNASLIGLKYNPFVFNNKIFSYLKLDRLRKMKQRIL